MTIEIGAEAPGFTLKNQHGEDVTLSAFRHSKSVLIVFYPFAFSGICTGELNEIRDNVDELGPDTEVLAVSCDHMFSLRAYAERDGLEFSLLSDFWPHGAVAAAYGVFNDSAGGADRGTYLVDAAGIVRWKVEHAIGDKRDFGEYVRAIKSL